MTPSSWASMSETSEERLQALIDALGLPVRLGMIRRAHAEFHAGELDELLPEVIREDGIAIREDGARETMERIDAVHVQNNNFSSSIRMGERKKVHKLGQLINQDKDAVCVT